MKRKTGWNEWSERRASLYLGCEHDCRYCFSRADALRFGRIHAVAEWQRPVLCEKEFARKWGKVSGIVAFPGTHDITPANVDVCLEYLLNILRPGNKVLIVSKPHLVVIQRVCALLSPHLNQMEFRFTIGARRKSLLRYWEPGAPDFDERLDSLKWAWCQRYRTSVSIEPMLDFADEIIDLVHAVRPFIRDGTIWIGKMNRIRQRVAIETAEDERRVRDIEDAQSDDCILELVAALQDDPLIRWKDSIREVIERHT